MNETVDGSIIKIISKEVMEQYEKIRRSGLTDMFNYYQVVNIANRVDFRALAILPLEDYRILLLNFQKLMKHYGIKQPELKKANTINEQKITKNTIGSTMKFHYKKS